jgi:hypothetical protein
VDASRLRRAVARKKVASEGGRADGDSSAAAPRPASPGASATDRNRLGLNLFPHLRETFMRAILRPFAAALTLACLPAALALAPVGPAAAQSAQPAAEATPVKQIALTEKQIQGVVAAKPAIDPIIAKLPEGNGQPDPKTLAALEGVVKKYGFASYQEFEDVDDNITLVVAGIDPQTKKYIGDEAVLKKEIADVQGDKQMKADEKKEAVAQLNDALKAVKPLQFPANIPLVVKYYDKLAADAPNND